MKLASKLVTSHLTVGCGPMCPPEWAGGESMWGNATIIDVDARSRAFRGLANDGFFVGSGSP